MDTPSLKKIFEGDLNVDKIIRTLSAYFPTINFEPYKTILVFDEVQECANARYSLKPFVIDGHFDVIATGSLLGIKGYNLNHDLKIPVGYESTFYMSSLDFEEYLLAKGINYNVIDYLKECLNNLTPIDEALHTKMLELFNEYIIVGGMPNVITNRNFVIFFRKFTS